MCGIIGCIGSKDPKSVLLDGLSRLEYRGYDSAGIAILEHDKVKVFRCEGRIQGLKDKLSDVHFESSVGIGHTRWATHGAPSEVNAHPHQVGAVTLVHNGIIENYLTHKAAIQKMGRTVQSETDSEIVAHLFDLEIQAGKSLRQALEKVLPQLKGNYAFVILNEREPGIVVGVRNGAPLLAGLGEHEVYVASDVQAILHRTNKIVYLEDRHAVICTPEGIEVLSAEGTPEKYEVKTLNWTPDQMEKRGYRHYMLKEIHEQPQAITQTLENNIDLARGVVALEGLRNHPDLLKKTKRISIVACGTARHAGLVGKYLIERFTGVPVDVDFASEFRYRDPILESDNLLLLISQSGETADTLAACQEGRRRGIGTLSICNVRESTLTRESDATIYTNAGPEIGVASTKAFTTQLTMLYMFAVELGIVNGKLSEADAKMLTADLMKLPVLMEKTLQTESQFEAWANELQDTDFFFYMGRGNQYPIALEGALKLKEISYIHAEGYAAGELKHGPIALIDKKTVIVTLGATDSPYPSEFMKDFNSTCETVYEKVMSNLQEVKSRGGRLVTIGSEGDTHLKAESNFYVEIPKAPWGLNAILMSIPVQFLAYYIALERGTDVDKPRNLAKSVTVE